MPRPKRRAPVLQQCQNCPNKLPKSAFKKSSIYCNTCMDAMRDQVEKQTSLVINQRQGALIDGMAKALEGHEPDLPVIVKKLIDAMGGHDGVVLSIIRAIANLEDRLVDGQIVSFEEAHRRGFARGTKDRRLLFQYHNLFNKIVAKNDEHRAQSNPYAGMNAEDMKATMRGVAKNHLDEDPEHRRWVISYLRRKYPDEFNVIPATATLVEETASGSV